MSISKRVLLVMVASIAALLAGAGGASAKPSSTAGCPKQAGQLYVSGVKNVRVWHTKTSVYACTHPRVAPKQKLPKGRRVRLGPWSQYSVFLYDSATSTAVWLEPRSDNDQRLWAVHVGGTPILAGVKARPATAADQPGDGETGYIGRFVVGAGLVGWVSDRSVFVAQLGRPEPVTTSTNLTPAPTSRGAITHMGSWPGTGVFFGSTLLVTAAGDGEGDECGGGGTAIVSVTPRLTPTPESYTLTVPYMYGDDYRCY